MAQIRATGLSPRVRGNQETFHPHRPSQRSIPACAGEPRVRRTPPAAAWVYPRVCGGTCFGRRRFGRRCGLSPRVRGNRAMLGICGLFSGSIPACAGEPRLAGSLLQFLEVYPRVCGGTMGFLKVKRWADGLSPRVRGNLDNDPATLPAYRSIPACAGEPTGGRFNRGDTTVYPRVCGGTLLGHGRDGHGKGLSPRVRGNPVSAYLQADAMRSIPACAGEPGAYSWPWDRSAVYPRVCGGTVGGAAAVCLEAGLSPRVRGNRLPGAARSAR